MKKDDQRQLDDNFIEQKIAEAFGYTEDQLSEELDRFMEEAEKCQEEIPDAPKGEFQRILDRAKAEMKGQRKSGHRVRRLIKVMAAAAIIGTMVLGGGIWVGARRIREYEGRKRFNVENMVTINNNQANTTMSEDIELDEAYAQIEDELNIQTLELSYLPEKMRFYEITIQEGKGIMKFFDGKTVLFFYQGLNDYTSSLSYASDMVEFKKIYNSFLDQEISIYGQELDGGDIELSSRFVKDNNYYFLHGVVDIEKFEQIVYGIKLYKK